MCVNAFGVVLRPQPELGPNEKHPWCTLCEHWATRGHLCGKDHARRLRNWGQPPFQVPPDSYFWLGNSPAASSSSWPPPDHEQDAQGWSFQAVLDMGIAKGMAKGKQQGQEYMAAWWRERCDRNYEKGKGVGFEKGKAKGAGKNINDLEGFTVVGETTGADDAKGKDAKGAKGAKDADAKGTKGAKDAKGAKNDKGAKGADAKGAKDGKGTDPF